MCSKNQEEELVVLGVEELGVEDILEKMVQLDGKWV